MGCSNGRLPRLTAGDWSVGHKFISFITWFKSKQFVGILHCVDRLDATFIDRNCQSCDELASFVDQDTGRAIEAARDELAALMRLWPPMHDDDEETCHGIRFAHDID